MNYDTRAVNEAAAAAGLPNGRMIGASKTAYSRRLPRNATVFNATITDESGAGLWRGDLDLTLDEAALAALARVLGTTLCVFYENDARRLGIKGEPAGFADAVLRITASGESTTSDQPARRLARNRAGRLVRRTAPISSSSAGRETEE
ncbi:MAG TPA: hypothetical protein VGM94_01640 [Galbitalea sp.]|jgi:hypothetical protein